MASVLRNMYVAVHESNKLQFSQQERKQEWSFFSSKSDCMKTKEVMMGGEQCTP
jgi:hypothetical protein